MSLTKKSVALAAIIMAGLQALSAPALASGRPDKNVILIIMDDSSWDDWPFLNPPLVWHSEDDPLGSPTDNTVDSNTLKTSEGRLFVPDLNRNAARMFANQGNLVPADEGKLGHPLGNSTDYVVPVDLDFSNSSSANSGNKTRGGFAYDDSQTACTTDTQSDLRKSTTCLPQKDVLRGFGGLGRLSKEGINFTRFYATSALCSPTRGSIFSGLHPHESGVGYNFSDLKLPAVTIAGVLKSPALAHEYRTAHLGKWHIGSKDEHAPTRRGWDMALWDKSSARAHWAMNPLVCQEGPLVCAPTNTTCGGSNDICFYDGTAFIGYPSNPQSCDNGQTCPTGTACTRWTQYVGSDGRKGCHPDDAVMNEDCCALSDYGGSDAGTYKFNAKVRATSKTYCSTTGAECNGTNCSGGICTAKRFAKYCENAFGTAAPDVFCDNGHACTSGVCKENRFWMADNRASNPAGKRFICNDDTQKGCAYDTRHYANRVVDFIARNQALNARDNVDRPFFISVALHAVHHPANAPARTESHYLTGLKTGLRPSGRRPNEGIMVWAAIEEVDAAIGRIIYAIEHSSISTLKADTVVLFTADQGRAKNNFGSPTLSGGKNQTTEGGIRSPLVIWGGNIAASVPVSLGSQVDLIQTIAVAANLDPGTNGRVEIKTCSGVVPTQVCRNNGDCPGQNPSCVAQPLSGYPLLGRFCSNNGNACHDDSNCTSGATCDLRTVDNRDFLYAWMSGDTQAIVSRADYYAERCDRQPTPLGNSDGVMSRTEWSTCAYAPRVCAHVSPPSSSASNVQHTIRATSRIACYDINDCGDSSNRDCTVLGGLCTNNTTVADVDSLEHCESDSDCKHLGTSCTQEVKTKCDKCEPAMWKARAGATTATVKEVYDVATNPEEFDKVKNSTAPGMNVATTLSCTNQTLTDSERRFCNVQSDLQCRLNKWWNNKVSGPVLEDLPDASPNPCSYPY